MLSRRTFLATSTVAAAGAACAPRGNEANAAQGGAASAGDLPPCDRCPAADEGGRGPDFGR